MQNKSAQNTPEPNTDTSSRKSGWQPDGSYILDDSNRESTYQVTPIQKPDANPNPPK